MKTARKTATKVRKTKKVVKRKAPVTKKKMVTKKKAPKARKPVGRTVATANFTGVRKKSKARVTKKKLVAKRKVVVRMTRPKREKLPTWKIKSYNRRQKKWWTLTYFNEEAFVRMMEYLLSIRCNFNAFSPTGQKLASCGV